MPKKTGKGYEILTKKVFDQLVNQKSVETIEVKHNVSLQGKDVEHQIDVYWEFKQGPITHKVVVQSKDHINKIKQGEIIQFKGVLDDLPGQPRGIFVTLTGYQPGAINVAEKNGIELYTLREVADTDRETFELKNFFTYQREIDTSNIKFIIDPEWLSDKVDHHQLSESEILDIKRCKNVKFKSPRTPHEKVHDIKVYDENGLEVTTLEDIFIKLFPKKLKEMPPTAKTFKFSNPTFIEVAHPKIQMVKVTDMQANIQIRKIPFEKFEFTTIVEAVLEDVLHHKRLELGEDLKPGQWRDISNVESSDLIHPFK